MSAATITALVRFAGAVPGRRLAFIAGTRAQGRAMLFDAVANLAGVKVRKANGQESVSWPNGSRVDLLTLDPRAWRGYSLDAVAVAPGIDLTLLDELAPCLAASVGVTPDVARDLLGLTLDDEPVGVVVRHRALGEVISWDATLHSGPTGQGMG